MAQPATHTRTGLSPAHASNSAGMTCPASASIGVGVAKEAGDRDQQIVEQGLRLFAMIAQIGEVLLEGVGLRHVHPPARCAASRSPACSKRSPAPFLPAAAPGSGARIVAAVSRVAFGVDVRLGSRRVPPHCAASCFTGSTKSAPLAIALRGIEPYSASSGSCTRMSPPVSRMARTPTDPSEPPPLSTIAKPSPCWAASDRKNRSIGARCPRGSSNLAVSINLFEMK